MKKKIIIIAGPTAIGKSDIGAKLANKIGGEVISADSMQIYKYMNIGSAKVTPDEMQGVPHHLIDFVDPLEDYSVAEYAKDARNKINDLFQQGKIPVIVGGTGLYINSLLYDMDFGKSAGNDDYRLELETLAREKGNEHLYQLLLSQDEEAASRIHPNNVKRVIRALEAVSDQSRIGDFSNDMKRSKDYEVILITLTGNRMKLYARINKRVEKMLALGLIEEVKSLKNMGLDDSFRSMQGIGYKEVLYFLDDKYDLEHMVSHIKQNSRRYAKRQLTWFRRYGFAKWFDVDDYDSIDDLCQSIETYVKLEYEQ